MRQEEIKDYSDIKKKKIKRRQKRREVNKTQTQTHIC